MKTENLTPEKERMKIFVEIKKKRWTKIKNIVPLVYKINLEGWHSSEFNSIFEFESFTVYFKNYKGYGICHVLVSNDTGRQYSIEKQDNYYNPCRSN